MLIADLRNTLETRLAVTFGSAGEPTDAEVDGYLRDAYAFFINAVPPIYKTLLPLSAGVATLPGNTASVWFVAAGWRLLFPSEWAEVGESLYVITGTAASGSDVGIWYQESTPITSGTSEVITTCALGYEWLAEPVLTLAQAVIETKKGSAAGSRGGGKHGAQQRVVQQERDKLVAMLSAQRTAWLTMMQRKIEDRARVGDEPTSFNRMRGIINLSSTPNNLYGDDH